MASDNFPRFNPYYALASGMLAVSTGAIFTRLANAPPLVIAAYRLGLATFILTPFVLWKIKDELRKLSRADFIFAAISGLFLAFHFATWISSLNYTSVANSVVLVNTNPLWVGLLSSIITGEKIKPVIFFSIFMSVVGVILVGLGDIAIGGKAFLGDILALTGAVCASIYLMLGRNLRRKLSLIVYVYICYGSAAVLLWGVVLTLNMKISGFTSETLAALWALALIPQLIGHTSYNWTLKWFSTSIIAISLLGEPIGSTILAYIIFNETLTSQKVFGCILIMIAIYLSAVNERKNN